MMHPLPLGGSLLYGFTSVAKGPLAKPLCHEYNTMDGAVNHEFEFPFLISVTGSVRAQTTSWLRVRLLFFLFPIRKVKGKPQPMNCPYYAVSTTRKRAKK